MVGRLRSSRGGVGRGTRTAGRRKSNAVTACPTGARIGRTSCGGSRDPARDVGRYPQVFSRRPARGVRHGRPRQAPRTPSFCGPSNSEPGQRLPPTGVDPARLVFRRFGHRSVGSPTMVWSGVNSAGLRSASRSMRTRAKRRCRSTAHRFAPLRGVPSRRGRPCPAPMCARFTSSGRLLHLLRCVRPSSRSLLGCFRVVGERFGERMDDTEVGARLGAPAVAIRAFGNGGMGA